MNWTDEQIQAVWEKGTTVDKNDPDIFRKDFQGNWIRRDKYGVDRDTQFQWEIHHVKKTSDGGSNDIDNLVPLSGKPNAKIQ